VAVVNESSNVLSVSGSGLVSASDLSGATW